MRALREVPREQKAEITTNHMIVGASLLDEDNSLHDLVSSVREYMFTTVIHVLQRNEDGSIHNGRLFRANRDLSLREITDEDFLEDSIMNEISNIPNFVGVYFTQPRTLLSVID